MQFVFCFLGIQLSWHSFRETATEILDIIAQQTPNKFILVDKKKNSIDETVGGQNIDSPLSYRPIIT